MQTIPHTAKGILQCSGPVPEQLRNTLNTVFIKPAKQLKKWQKEILINPDEYTNKTRHLKSECKPAVHNAILLCYLIEDSGKVRELFSFLLEGGKNPIPQLIKGIRQRAEQQFSEFFCLGVVQESLAPVIAQIENTHWNPLTDALPSPFSTGDLTPLSLIYGKEISWSDYHERYSAALVKYQENHLDEAQALLETLETDAVIRLPVVSVLRRQIHKRLNAAENYFEYLQKNL